MFKIFLLILGFVVGVANTTIYADAMGVNYFADLREKLDLATKSKGTDYQPRTEHINSDGKAVYTNRLILDSSPYLIQHAHNPVNWYAWGPEAFAQAKKENKLIFLSIGYSTCHWCHVMEKESFENLMVAQFLNQHFIAIKVDREQRPDVDATFMDAVMLIQGSGGWPMTVFLTPEGKPFYGGTYYPADKLMSLLNSVNNFWATKREQVLQTAEQVTSSVQQRSRTKQSVVRLNKDIVTQAAATIMSRFDELQGGFSQAPKFPNETYLFLLLDQLTRRNNSEIFDAVNETLTAMAAGGIYDQVGGGFHRYATDNEWLVPHFEKMLYNQAHLGRVYSRFYQLSGNSEYARISRQIFDYVLRDMTSDEGGFYSASDADSEEEEGTFFLWQLDELKKLLTQEQLQLAIELYGVTELGNFEHKNILYMQDSLKDFAKHKQQAYDDFSKQVDELRESLYQHREKRIHPFVDKKVLTAWNGMMIGALAKASLELQEPKYLAAAIKATEYLNRHNYDQKYNKLWRSSLDGQAEVLASQEDYAYFAQGLIYLSDVSNSPKLLYQAEKLTTAMVELFWDKEEGGFFMDNPSQDMSLIIRPKDIFDGAIPSGNSIALEVLVALFKRTGKPFYEEKAQQLIAAVSEKVLEVPNAFSYLLTALNNLHQGEVGRVQFGARGNLRAQLKKAKSDKKGQQVYLLHINIDGKWHINSHHPNQDDLIATNIVLDSINIETDGKRNITLQSVEYPEAVEKNLSFNQTLLSLYEGQLVFKITLKAKENKDINRLLRETGLSFSFQACSDQVCLSPEQLRFSLNL